MNREILFRGKSIGTGGWLYGHLFNYGGITAPRNMLCISVCVPTSRREAFNLYAVHPDTIGQYTGLKDKNGNKIFEGDIVAENGGILGSIVLSLRYGVSILKNSTTWSLRNFCIDSDFDFGTLINIEVVGNIHDNPELLKGGK